MPTGSVVVPAGTTYTLGYVPDNATIGVNPGTGGTMNVQSRVSDNGPLRDWPSSTVAVMTVDTTTGKSSKVMFIATGADGLAEWNW